jgi:hypothetical protein
MNKHAMTTEKQERVIEAVRRGLDGDAAVAFIRNCGYAMSPVGIARHLKSLGGRAAVETLISEGRNNIEIIQQLNPEADTADLPVPEPSQQELFVDLTTGDHGPALDDLERAGFETTKMTLRLPTDVYEALRLASRAENRTQNELIVDILTNALSQMPRGFLIDGGE